MIKVTPRKSFYVEIYTKEQVHTLEVFAHNEDEASSMSYDEAPQKKYGTLRLIVNKEGNL